MVRLFMQSTHTLSVVLAVGAIAVATKQFLLVVQLIKTVSGSTASSPSAFAAASFVI